MRSKPYINKQENEANPATPAEREKQNIEDIKRRRRFYANNGEMIVQVICSLLRDQNRSHMETSRIIDEAALIVNEITIRANFNTTLEPHDPEYGRTPRGE